MERAVRHASGGRARIYTISTASVVHAEPQHLKGEQQEGQMEKGLKDLSLSLFLHQAPGSTAHLNAEITLACTDSDTTSRARHQKHRYGSLGCGNVAFSKLRFP
jgi:hypothetical protein